MKVLVDNGIVSGSNFLISDSREQELRWGDSTTRMPIAGFRRVELDADPEQQGAKDALFTVGRLVRERRVSLYTYSELVVEKWRGGRGREPFVNTFSECLFGHCESPIERSKFRQTLDMAQWFAKGGKADRKKGRLPSDLNQIPYLTWLSSLSEAEASILMNHASILSLSDFEIASLRDLRWFQDLSRAIGGLENLPDCFHLWTVRRNNLDAFLTLEKKLPRTIEGLRSRRDNHIDVGVAVLRPLDLLCALGVTNIDPVPLMPDRFYTYQEIFGIKEKLIRG